MNAKFGVRGGFGVLIGLIAFQTVVCGQEMNLSPTFAGRAIALEATPWKGEPIALAQTGLVPPQGGERQSSLRDTPPIPGLSAHLLYAITTAAGSQNHSQASLNSMDIKMGAHEVTALWIESEATASAGFLGVPTAGKTTVQGLLVDGQSVTVTGEANQTIRLADGFLIINEQTSSSSQRMGTLTVNALHLLVDGVGSVIAASSTAEVINTPTRTAAF
jgi:hypothetical protein